MGIPHLHIHSNYSLCRGASSVEAICAAARTRGVKTLAVTDTNGLYGLVWFIQRAKEHGLTPLVGAELRTKTERCVVLAKNMRGYASLCRIITARHCREEFDLFTSLTEHGEGIVVFSDSLHLLKKLKTGESLKDVYVELTPHSSSLEALLRFSRASNTPPLATGDVYFVDRHEWPLHRLLRAIDLNTTLERVARDELCARDAYLRSAREMAEAMSYCPEALENASKVAAQCVFELDFGGFIFTSFKGPRGEDAFEYLARETERGARWRYGGIDKTVRNRMNYELDIIGDKGYAPYFLVVADIVRHAPRTCGRGSAAASLVSYCLGITHVDPVRYDLFFERFLHPGRLDPPDIDVDFPWDERDDILEYIFTKYGYAATAMISNHNGFRARAAVREVAKVYGLPEAEINAVTKRLSHYWTADRISGVIATHPIFRHAEFREPWPEILQWAELLTGFPRHLSVHCGGVVIAPGGLDRYVPQQLAKKQLAPRGVIEGACRDRGNGVYIVQWEKDQSEDMGLVKMDILGNRSLAVIRDALAAVKENYGTDIKYATWNPLEDRATQKLLAEGNTLGVFYVESPAMRQLQKKAGKGDFEHLVIHSSLIRPAANKYINEYLRRLKGGSYRPLHPLVDGVLRETFGIMVYQEDVSKVAIALAGFSAAEADMLRKIISKKNKEKTLRDFRDRFHRGAAARNVPREVCEKIWDMILSFSGYSFCKPHSASYVLVSFKSAYLRAHYPAEFMAAVISNCGGYYSPFAYLSECRRMGLQVLLPDINWSERQYTGYKGVVRIGFMQIKGLTGDGLETLLRERRRGGLYLSFDDFMKRTRMSPADARVLIKAGAFDVLELKRARPELMWRLEWWLEQRKKQNAEKVLSLFEREGHDPKLLPKPVRYDEKTVLRQEVETLGFLLSRHPLRLFLDRLKDVRYVEAKDLHKYVGRKVTALGWLITAKITETKNGEMMEFMSFEDTTAIYETTFFPRAYAEFIHMISKDRPFLLSGKVESHYGAITLTVEYVRRV